LQHFDNHLKLNQCPLRIWQRALQSWGIHSLEVLGMK
jgi:hypothetical protein